MAEEKMNGSLEIKPEGWIDSLILENRFGNCGRAYRGIPIRLKSSQYGGVISIDDMVRLRDFINKHLTEISRETAKVEK